MQTTTTPTSGAPSLEAQLMRDTLALRKRVAELDDKFQLPWEEYTVADQEKRRAEMLARLDTLNPGSAQDNSRPMAIQTEYAGCLFRSRLEARWAVFFDACKITWRYEPEGYELPSGRYLPDFFLPIPEGMSEHHDAGFFVEIKPKMPGDDRLKLARELARETKHRTIVFAGDPLEFDMYAAYSTGYIDRVNRNDEKTDWGACPMQFALWCVCHVLGGDGSAIQRAQVSARSARFEFGETPRR